MNKKKKTLEMYLPLAVKIKNSFSDCEKCPENCPSIRCTWIIWKSNKNYLSTERQKMQTRFEIN